MRDFVKELWLQQELDREDRRTIALVFFVALLVLLAVLVCTDIASAQVLPSRPQVGLTEAAPRKPKVVDCKFLALSAAEIIGDGLDIWTSVRSRENPNVYEINPLLGRNPSATRMAMTQLPFSIAANVIAYKMRKSRRFNKVWEIPFALSLAGSAWGVESNVKQFR